ncbi:hypothetical protein K505DRAFT_151382 [Melanomma pulvis-pyrius CBS 109.77]|uniref:Uncharacterized protein n=1 Tax=Melanomma pulvis-pyrius CBS 109.77 TaxID=1314802 RepID=A0A6A6XM96_9PLEO|nr:hypothetical protein K505DRAFT_151382 [Melanomma pulvis-pyrius CBS 109.77]
MYVGLYVCMYVCMYGRSFLLRVHSPSTCTPSSLPTTPTSPHPSPSILPSLLKDHREINHQAQGLDPSATSPTLSTPADRPPKPALTQSIQPVRLPPAARHPGRICISRGYMIRKYGSARTHARMQISNSRIWLRSAVPVPGPTIHMGALFTVFVEPAHGDARHGCEMIIQPSILVACFGDSRPRADRERGGRTRGGDATGAAGERGAPSHTLGGLVGWFPRAPPCFCAVRPGDVTSSVCLSCLPCCTLGLVLCCVVMCCDDTTPKVG